MKCDAARESLIRFRSSPYTHAMGIVVEELTKTVQGTTALDSISFEVNDGDFATLLGATGSGKTSLLRLIAGIDRPDSGRVFFDGQDVTQWPVQKRSVAFVYQQFVNYPSLTIFENIASPLRVNKPVPSQAEIGRRVEEAADLLGLRHVLKHRPDEVSGGQQQRTAIARALIKNSKFMFLDEPLANLDYKLREELRGELKRIFRERGGCAIYATPEPVDALSMATHVGFMQHGRLVQYGPTQEVYREPCHREVGAYFSYPEMNILDAEARETDGQLTLIISESLVVPWPFEQENFSPGPCLVGIRAHALRTEDLRQEGDVLVAGTVELAEVVGSDTEVHFAHDQHPLISLVPTLRNFTLGSSTTFCLSPQDCYLFDAESGDLRHASIADSAVV